MKKPPDLSRLLQPKSIALFGSVWVENVIMQLKKSDFDGDIWPVHPKRKSIGGIDCHHGIKDLPGIPDASFIAVNCETSIEVVRDLATLNAGGAICFASGFLESESEKSGGAQLQEQLVKAAGSMPVLGPNCYGLINYLDMVTLWPDQHGGRQVDKGVAIIGQSSNIAINMTMQKRSLPIAYMMTAGNQAQTGLSEIASSLLGDPRVTAIGLYIEGFGDIHRFEAMAMQARAVGKPVVALKVGKSEKSRTATMTHTASLAGGATASSVLLRRLGIVEVNSIAVFLETLKLLHVLGPLPGNAVSSISCSGGEAGLMADMAASTKLNFRDISPKQGKALKSVLGPIVTIANPLDYHTFIWGDATQMQACFSAVLQDRFDLNIFVLDLPRDDLCDVSAWDCLLDAIIAAKQATNARVAVMAILPENLPEPVSERFLKHDIVPLNGMEEGLAAIDAAINAGEFKIDPDKYHRVLLATNHPKTGHFLSEAQAKDILQKHGLPVPANAIAGTIDDIPGLSASLHFPVVLKGLGIAHKSEVDAVILDIQTLDELKIAARNIPATASGFLIEEMIEPPVAEILIGIIRDATGTFVLTIAAGGILTELIADSISLLLPVNRKEVQTTIKNLKIHSLLTGFRGKPAADIKSLIDAVMAVQDYAITHHQILLELDINPLLALPERVVAVDALIKLTEKPA